MKLHTALLAWLLAGLAGCSVWQRNDAPTIADLDGKPVTLEDQPLVASEQQAMQAYRKFLATPDHTEARPQAMRRLADISLEAESAPAETGAAAAPLQVEDSIRLYRQVLDNYPQRADNDHVLYQLARAYEVAGRADEALATLTTLAQRYPQSRYRQEAQFRRGEIEFVGRHYAVAAVAYRAVIDSGADNAFYAQSLYKLGWCDFKQGLYEEGNATFLKLLDRQLGDRDASGSTALGRADQERLDDTLRAMSLAFSYEDGPGSVAALFRGQGERRYEDLIYRRLGELYLDKERYTDAAQTFQSYVDNHPLQQQAPLFQMRVIDAYKAAGFPTLVLEGKKQFVERYNLQSAYWQRHDRNAAGEVLGLLKSTMIDLSRHYHALAQSSHKAADYSEAGRWYRSFLGSFGDSAEAPGMHFLLAELLFESGADSAAAAEYIHTAYDYGVHEHAAEAGYASVLAYAKQEARLDGVARDDWHRAGLENALRFATTFPEHAQALAVLSNSAEQLLALRDNTRAIEVARRVTASNAASADQQRVCWTVQAHAWFELEDYLQAEQAYQQVLARTAANSAETAALTEKLAASIYKQGEAAQAAGATAAAVAHFQRVQQAAPTASIVATAQYDAAAGQLQLQDWQGAAGTLRGFRARFPDDPRQAEVTRRLASAYLQGAQPLAAAGEFERMGHTASVEATLRRDALWQAAGLYGKAGQARQATAVYEYFVSQFPQPVDSAIEACRHIATFYRDSGDMVQQEHWLNEIIRTDAGAGAARSDRTRYLAASARQAQADRMHERYRAADLQLPLAQSLATKKRLLKETLALYEQAAAYDIAEVTTAATYHSAEVYAELATALLKSARPRNLDADALEQYNVLLEDQAYPFEEQAIQLHETNSARMDGGLYDAWIGRSLQALATLVPAKYAKLERGASYVTALR